MSYMLLKMIAPFLIFEYKFVYTQIDNSMMLASIETGIKRILRVDLPVCVRILGYK